MQIDEIKIEPGVFADTKVVVFDVGGVILQFKGGLEALSEKTGLSYGRCQAIWLELDAAICRGAIQLQELWHRVKKEAAYTGPDINFVDFWVSHFKPNTEVHQLMRDLQQNYSLGLLTNIYPGVYRKAVEAGNIPDLPYTFVVESCEVGLAKPEIGIYELTQQMSGKNFEHILFVDDRQEFIEPARTLGWKTFAFDAKAPAKSAAEIRYGLGL